MMSLNTHDVTVATEEEEEVLTQMAKTINAALQPQGMKFDSGKRDYTLVPWDGLEEVVKVLEFGAKKYARDNWKLVEKADIRYLAAAFRHMIAYNSGERTDPETGLSHLAHVGCCILFLLSLEKNTKG